MGRTITIEFDENGNRHIIETITPEGTILCLTCDGEGTIEGEDNWGMESDIPCPECDGNGYVTLPTPKGSVNAVSKGRERR